MSGTEPWPRIYREAPEVFEAFGRAEDPDGKIAHRVAELAGLKGREVLDIGCGAGRYAREWAPQAGRYLALEPDRGLRNLAANASRSGAIHWLAGRGERLPLRDESMERVVATWVLAYLRPETCRRTVAEALRVLRPGGGIWLAENHWAGPFQELRDRLGPAGEPGVQRLLQEHGFRVVEVIETELRFPSTAEAQHILGTLCGPAVTQRLEHSPRARIGHQVVLLHRAKE